MLIQSKRVLCSLLLALPFASAAACDFDCTLSRHLQALQQHDWALFESTLSDGHLPFILPNGALSLEGDRYREMLQPWFAEAGWTFKAREVHREVSSDMALVLLDVDYDEPDRGGKPYHLTLFSIRLVKSFNIMM